MQKSITIQNQTIEYLHTVSRRSRRIRLTIHPGGKIIVTSPMGVNESHVQRFIMQKASWILSRWHRLKKLPVYDPAENSKEYQALKTQALALAKQRIEYFNKFYNFRYSKISIKNNKSLWGSCSKTGNLNFHYKIVRLPPEQADYVIVHELCHLKEFNHSQKFWNLVAQTIPNHKKIRRDLKKTGLNFA